MGIHKEYQGHRSWNAWNVSLYLSNDYEAYKLAEDCVSRSTTMPKAFRRFLRESGMLGTRTPDGATYNRLALRLAFEGLELEHLLGTKGEAV